MAAIIAWYSVYAHYHQRVGMYVCEPARVGACLFVKEGIRRFSLFRIVFCGPIDCGPAVRGRIKWISCQVNLSRMIFHRFDLPLPVLRGSKERIWKKSLLQQLRRPYRMHTPLVSVNAVNMWCMECVWISYRILECVLHAPLG